MMLPFNAWQNKLGSKKFVFLKKTKQNILTIAMKSNFLVASQAFENENGTSWYKKSRELFKSSESESITLMDFSPLCHNYVFVQVVTNWENISEKGGSTIHLYQNVGSWTRGVAYKGHTKHEVLRYHATKHRATRLSPFQVLFGRKMFLPIHLIDKSNFAGNTAGHKIRPPPLFGSM